MSRRLAVPTVGSLFSGIGGLDLGFERAGMRVIWHSEIDPFASKVLHKHWPDIPNLGDVTKIDWSEVERPDVLVGGYPCQPFSVAGRREGEHDERHLWPHMLEAIRQLRPRFAVMENVTGHLSLGFGRVLGDLAESGYDCEWDCLPASAVGAPHQRDRVFIVAHAHDERLQRRGECRFSQGVGQEGAQPAGGRSARRGEPLAHPHDAPGSSQRGQHPHLQGEDHGGVDDRGGSLGDARRRTFGLGCEGQDPGVVADADCSARYAEGGDAGSLQEPGSLVGAGRRGGLGGTRDVPDPEGAPFGAGLQPGEPEAFGRGRPRDDDRQAGKVATDLADPDDAGRSERRGAVAVEAQQPPAEYGGQGGQGVAGATQSRLGGSAHGLPPRLDPAALTDAPAWLDGSWEDGLPRLDRDIPDRPSRIRTLGNAVVPQVAEWIARRIMEVDW